MTAKNQIAKKEMVNKLLNWVDACVCKIIESGKTAEVEIGIAEEKKSDSQRGKFHAMISDIHKTGVLLMPGNRIVMKDYDIDQCKALLVVWFAKEMEQLGEPLPKPPRNFTDPLTGQQISIRPSTTEWGKKTTCDFVIFLYSTGAMMNTKWSEPALKEYDSYMEAQ